ncbi:MAG: hypothetical protein H7A25_07595 [Leptospiraceae bacterium]|nr:hypothetical protein [Leptospiraceae bacterium]MCP5499748.1 hypothetical protein [Leptospiraceae bacterium]
MYANRLIETKLQKLFKYFPVVCLQGARQVCKSTLIETVFRGNLQTVTFDPVQDISGARKEKDILQIQV